MLTPINAAEMIPVLTAWSRCCVSLLFGFNSTISASIFLIMTPVIIALVEMAPRAWVLSHRVHIVVKQNLSDEFRYLYIPAHKIGFPTTSQTSGHLESGIFGRRVSNSIRCKTGRGIRPIQNNYANFQSSHLRLNAG